MKITHSQITVSGIEVYARHGVLDIEKKVGNDFRVDVTLGFDATAAMDYDDIDATVNYALVIDIVRGVMNEPCELIERAARRVIDALVDAFPMVTSGTVTVAKLHPPVSVPVTQAAFSASFVK